MPLPLSKRWLTAGLFGAIFAAGAVFVALNARASKPLPGREIFQGIVYGRERLEDTDEGGGLVHWARINLRAAGIGLYVTPLDVEAVAEGFQYRLRRTGDVVEKEHLAIAINGMLFDSRSIWKLRLPGDFARGVETAVAEHVVSHIWEHTYLLGFDDSLAPHLSLTKPPDARDLARSKWAVGGQGVALQGGRVSPGSDRHPDSRTAVGVDEEHRLLFMAVGENVSPRRILQTLADKGARDGMMLDGGGSSSMAIGDGARGINPGVLYGGWRAVATHFGVRARSLP